MSPILGIIASSISGSISSSSYESIATATGTGSSPTITFSSIPSTYSSLQIRVMYQGVGGSGLYLRLNSDSGSNYALHRIYGSGSTVTAQGFTAQTQIVSCSSSTTTANTMATVILDLHDYASTTKNKTVRGFAGFDDNGSGRAELNSGLWLNTSAVTSVSLISSGTAFTSNTTISLYGIKGS
jgi:hypothetical protein